MNVCGVVHVKKKFDRIIFTTKVAWSITILLYNVKIVWSNHNVSYVYQELTLVLA